MNIVSMIDWRNIDGLMCYASISNHDKKNSIILELVWLENIMIFRYFAQYNYSVWSAVINGENVWRKKF